MTRQTNIDNVLAQWNQANSQRGFTFHSGTYGAWIEIRNNLTPNLPGFAPGQPLMGAPIVNGVMQAPNMIHNPPGMIPSQPMMNHQPSPNMNYPGQQPHPNFQNQNNNYAKGPTQF